jgi:triphosphoribosyl-dephospho-CoA synthase
MFSPQDHHTGSVGGSLRLACMEYEAAAPLGVAPHGPGWAATMACGLEAAAPKPGNVHPGASFADLSHAELLAAATAIGPVLEQAATAPLGEVILDAVRRSRGVTRSNANLGMILAIAPLAALPADAWAEVHDRSPGDRLDGAVHRVLARLTPHDAACIWEAIAVAGPGGLGSTGQHDLRGPPPDDILIAMRLAADHDQIARLWAGGYADLRSGLVADLEAGLSAGGPWREAVVKAFLRQLARTPDSLVARRHGSAAAAAISTRAAGVLAVPPAARAGAIAAFDRSLRDPVRLNPGTSADLVATALYILLRSTLQ